MRKNVYDVTDKAKCYAEGGGIGHYKLEVYGLYSEILSTLNDGDVVLDIGGGPGHLPQGFFEEFPEKNIQYWILDGSRELLKYAEGRFPGNDRIHTGLIDFNSTEWCQDLPRANAIVCNNTLFHMKHERITDFYKEMSGLLLPGGFYLNQQSMCYPGGYHPHQKNAITNFFSKMPYGVMPQMPQFTEEEHKKKYEWVPEVKERHEKEMAQAKEEEDIDPTIYYFHSTDEHLEALRGAGLEATIIWRKKEFLVFLGIKE